MLDVDVGGNRAVIKAARSEISYDAFRRVCRFVYVVGTLLCGRGLGSHETMTVNVNGRRHLAGTTQEG